MVSSSKRAALLGIPLGFGAGKIGSELGVSDVGPLALKFAGGEVQLAFDEIAVFTHRN